MYSSQGSHASSSDLYSSSEPDDEAEPSARSKTSSLVIDVRQLSPADPVPVLEEQAATSLGARNTAGNVALPDDDSLDQGSAPGMFYTWAGQVDSRANGSYKRKRDDSQTDRDTTIFRRSPYQNENLSPLPKANSGGSSIHTSTSIGGYGSFVNNSPENKRTRTIGDFSGPVAQATAGADGIGVSHLPLGPSELPAEIWQHIFNFVPPVSLGRLLRVNCAFNRYLSPRKAGEHPFQGPVQGVVRPVDPEVIWAASRKRFCPGLPKPMRDTPELVMWRLLRGNNCQICREAKVPRAKNTQTNPWEAGPGDDGVRVIWPFGIRCCGKCLQEQSEKVFDFLAFASVRA